jgi:hypothetical protein
MESAVDLWEYLVRQVKLDHIDTNRKAANTLLDSAPFWEFNKNSENGTSRYDGSRELKRRGEWKTWQQNLAALCWLAKHRDKKRTWGNLQEFLGSEFPVPSDVAKAIQDVLSRIQVAIEFESGKPLSETPICIRATSRDGFRKPATTNPNQGFSDLQEFWQIAFVGFFDRNALRDASVTLCNDCGAPLPSTQKKSNTSRAKRCGRCRQAKFRRENPDHIREYDRERKKAERRRT